MEKGERLAVETIIVGLAERSYPIQVGIGNLGSLGSLCREGGLSGKAVVITNPTVAALYLAPVLRSLVDSDYEPIVLQIPDGEEYKSSETLQQLYDGLIENGGDRGSFIIALGGGVVGDIAGFAAATYLRGIPFVQVPTTLLAQVDSSVGGKTGINHPRGKNLIGAFYQPKFVLIDLATLETLPEREYLCGLAEAVKYGIVLDRDFFEFMEAHIQPITERQKDALLRVVATSCRIKSSVVERDEREGGLRAVLNYGHTIGHAVETLTGYRRFKHGEAVAIGMAQVSSLAFQKGLATDDETRRVTALLKNLGFFTELPDYSPDDYAEIIGHDKKKRDDGVTFIFNRGIGDFVMEKIVDVRTLLLTCVRGEHR
jgi:3-dehydroquinate synthase